MATRPATGDLGRLDPSDDGLGPGDDLDAGGSLAPAVTRAAAILDLLAATRPTRPARASSPAVSACPSRRSPTSSTRWPTPGLVRRVGAGYGLGRKLAELGGVYLAAIDLVQEFYDACHELPAASDETIQLAVLDGLEMTYLARHEGRQQVRLTSGIGRRLPATVTATGKASLAALDDRELDLRLATITALPRLTAHSLSTVEALRSDVEAVRRRGHAIDDEETVEGVICLGVAIRPRRAGEGPYAASVTLLKARATEERIDALIKDLGQLTRRLSDPMRPADQPRR